MPNARVSSIVLWEFRKYVEVDLYVKVAVI